jgi:flagellar hook-basal body complex protein FliE
MTGLGAIGANGNPASLPNGFSPDFNFRWSNQYLDPKSQAPLQAGISANVFAPPPVPGIEGGEGASKSGATPGKLMQQFEQILGEQFQQLNDTQVGAEDTVQRYAAGEDIPLHQVMMQLNQAELSMSFASQLRNKALGAYQEVIRMPL